MSNLTAPLKYEYFQYPVEGFSVSPDGYNWKNRIILTDANRPGDNVSILFVGVPYNEGVKFRDLVNGAVRLATLFLATYHLTARVPVKLLKVDSHAISAEEDNLPWEYMKQQTTDFDCRYRTLVTDTMRSLASATPLVDKIITFLENQVDHPLEVGLVMYHRAFLLPERIADLVDLITAPEALYSDGASEIAFKVALRATLLTEADPSKRRETFTGIRDAYAKRSQLVHGSKRVPSRYLVEFGELIPLLDKTLTMSLHKMIELYSKGWNRNDILRALDSQALGSMNFLKRFPKV